MELQEIDTISFGGNARITSIASLSSNCNFLRRERHNDFDQVSVYSLSSDVDNDAQLPYTIPLSPLSMLFEGILADSESIANMEVLRDEESPFPYSPVAEWDCSRSSFLPLEGTEDASPSTASTELNTPGASQQSRATALIDMTLAEIYAQNARLVANAQTRAGEPLVEP